MTFHMKRLWPWIILDTKTRNATLVCIHSVVVGNKILHLNTRNKYEKNHWVAMKIISVLYIIIIAFMYWCYLKENIVFFIHLIKGGNLSSPNQDGRSALHVATREGHLSTVQYLLHQGASIHLKDCNGFTPLHDAIKGKHLSIIRLLVKTGAILTLKPITLAMELCWYGTTLFSEKIDA